MMTARFKVCAAMMVALLFLLAADAQADHGVKVQTIQSLHKDYMGEYLNWNDGGGEQNPYLELVDTKRGYSNIYWQINYTKSNLFVRGYRSSVILQRGDNPANGTSLVVHDNHQLSAGMAVRGLYDGAAAAAAVDRGNTFSRAIIEDALAGKDAGDSRWIIRYIGFRNGYSAFTIQGSDMSFLTAVPAGDDMLITMQPNAEEGSYWFLKPGPTLPTDQIK